MRRSIFKKCSRRVECVYAFCVLLCGAATKLDEFEGVMDAEIICNGLLASAWESNESDEHDGIKGEVILSQLAWIMYYLTCRVSPKKHACQVQKTRPFPFRQETRSSGTSAAAGDCISTRSAGASTQQHHLAIPSWCGLQVMDPSASSSASSSHDPQSQQDEFVFYVARHGHRMQWRGNELNLSPTGRPRDPVLTAHGVDQVKKMAEFFKNLPAHQQPQMIISSPYYRCVQTAGPTAEALDLNIHIEPGEKRRRSRVVNHSGNMSSDYFCSH